MNNNNQNTTNPQNPQNPQNPPNSQFQRPQYGANPQMPFQTLNPQMNSRYRSTTVGPQPGVTVGAQISPSGSGAPGPGVPGQRQPALQPLRSRPGFPANATGTQMPGGQIRPPTMSGFPTQQNNMNLPGANTRTPMMPGMPLQNNPGQFNQPPGYRNPLSQSQRPSPQNIPGLQQKRPNPPSSPTPQLQPQPIQPMGFSSTFQQSALRSSQDPPQLRSNSPLYPNANQQAQQKPTPQNSQLNQQPQQPNQPPQQTIQQPQQINKPPQQTIQPPNLQHQQINKPPQQTIQPPNLQPQQINKPPNLQPQQINQPPNLQPQQINKPPQQTIQPPNLQPQQINKPPQQTIQPPNLQPQKINQPPQQTIQPPNLQPQQINQPPNLQPQQINKPPQQTIQPPNLQPQQINQPPNLQPQQINKPPQQTIQSPNLQPQQINQPQQQMNQRPQQTNQWSQQMNQRPQQPQQNQIFFRTQQPQQKQQPFQQQTNSFQQMQLELKQQFRKQQEDLIKQQQQLSQQQQQEQQQKRMLLQKKQEEMEKNEAQQKALDERQQIQQQQILDKIAQANDNFPQQKSVNQSSQPIQPPQSQTISNSSTTETQPLKIEPLTPPSQQLPQVEPLAPLSQQPQLEPLVPPQQPQVEPLTPAQQQLPQIEPLAPLSQQPIQLEPLVPPQQPQVEPLTPAQQQLPQIEPLQPLPQQPLQIEPLVPPQQPQVEPLAPPQQQLQIEPLVPPQQQLQIEPLVPPQQPQVEPLVPPQQPLQVEPLTPPQESQQTQPLSIPSLSSPIQTGTTGPINNQPIQPFGSESTFPPLNTEGLQTPEQQTNFAFPNLDVNSNIPQLSENTHKVNFGFEPKPVTLDFNEELSGDEDETPDPSQFRVRRAQTLNPSSNNQTITFDSTKKPKFFGRRETIMMQQGTRKRRNSSFQACLAPELNEEDMKSVNSQIQGILDDPNSGMNKFSWSSHYVVNCVQEENPYVDPKAISLSMQAAGGNNNIVKLFSENVRPIHFQKIDETPPAAPNTEAQNIPMISDIVDKSKPPTLAQLSNPVEVPNAADYFFKKAPPPPLLFTIEDMPIVGLSKRKFASFRIRDIKTEFEIIEPLFFGAFLIQDGTIISEQWTFTTKGSSQFIQDIPNVTKASFQLPDSIENTYLCVVVSRFLLPENGATVNKYYQKPNAKSLQAAKNQASYYAEFSGVYAPFAFTYIDLKTVLDNKYLDMPPPFAVNTPIKNIIKQIKSGGQKIGDYTYSIYMTFDANILEASHIQDILVENSLLVRLARPLPLTPCYSFRHRLLVRMNQVNLHTTSRNIYAELKVKSELGELPIFTTAYSNMKSKTVFTRCWYHDKKPFFDELFVIDLPLPLPKSLSLTITFFNASLKNVGQKGVETKEMIGVSTIPLLEGNNKFLSDGEHQYPVEYRGQPSNTTPAFNITTLLDSSLISTDSNLNQFFESVDSKVLEKCSDREVTINMFSVIDQIVNHFMDKGSECMKSLAILTMKKVSLDWNIIENCLNDYAIYFAFRNENSQTPQFHRSLFSSWAEFMRTNPDSNRTDSRLITFFFNMIIKSLYLTKDQDFSKEFSAFIIQWSKLLDPQQIGEYARFLNLLFDVGCYYYAVVAIECQMANLLTITSKHQILIEFLSQVLRPKLFYSALVYVDRLKLNIIDMIKYSKRTDCTTLQFIYRTFLRLFAQYSEEMKQKIAERLINSLEILSPFESVHFIENDGNHPVIYYYCFILSCISYDAFSNWLSHQVDHFADFFKTLHFMIDKIQDKELRRVSYFAILHIISFIVQMKDVEGIIEATNIIYHFLCVDLPQDFVCPLINTFSQLIEENYEILCSFSNPALPRHLAKLLDLTYLVPNEVYNVFRVLYETDARIYGNNLRSQAICYRAVSSLKSLDFIKIPPEIQLPIIPIINNLKNILQVTKSQLSEEKLTELIFQRAKMMFPSPDSSIECLNELIEYHRAHEYSAEEIQVLILQASIILEFLVAQNKMDISYLNIKEPSKVFSELCPICDSFRCPEGGNFIIKTYCDSPMFSERSLINHLIFIIERSMETKYHEIGYLLIDRIWPILEHRRIYTLLTNTFTRFGDCYKALAEIPPDEDRLFGHYFRICFYGKVFNEENGKIFIYREKKLTHLFELTNRLVDYYTEICKPTKIELIKESGAVDASKLDPNLGYIQITFVEPYFPKDQNYTRITSYERSHVLDSFFFDTPFTKGGNKAQASIDQQWVRRTVLHVEEPMPSVVKRINVTLSEEIEFAPIRVAYRQIRDRINLLKNAIERSDYRAIQQLLHGSLLVQVNEGPSRMAEVFLGEQTSENDQQDLEVYHKYRDKMKVAFKEFLTVNQKGIDLHGKYVEDHSVFIPLQHELESGFTALQEKISKYIQI